jgi:hypothetical protein
MKPSPKGGGFLFYQILIVRSLWLYFVWKWCMTLILCYGNPDKNAEGRQMGVLIKNPDRIQPTRGGEVSECG